jgi:transposase
VVGVEQWAEIRRLHRVDGVSIREISRRTGLHRKTIRRALAAPEPPRYSRPAGGSKVDPFKGWICDQLSVDPRIQLQRLREMATELGYDGGKSIFDDYVREVRPRFSRPRTFQRTIYRPGELVQCDLWEPADQIPVGHGQRRRGWVVTCEVCWSRAIAGTLVFSKEAPDILFGLGRNLQRLGALLEKLVWDREAAIAAGGRPTEPFASFCGQLSIGWVILEPRDPQAKGALERSHRFMRSNFEPGRVFANHLDFQDRLDAWTEKANRRVHRTIRAIPADRLADERKRTRRLPARMPDTDRRQVCGFRRSRSFGWIATITRSTRRSLAGVSRSVSRRPRSPRSCWTWASSLAGTGACSRAGSRSPTLHTRPGSNVSAPSAGSVTRSRSRSRFGRCRAMTS